MNKNRSLSILLIGMLAACGGFSVVWGADMEAEELMARVRAAVPDVPLDMKASIRLLNKNGRTLKTLAADTLYLPTDAGRDVQYSIQEGGGSLEVMTIHLADGAPAAFSYARGNPPVEAPLPDLFSPIGGSEISWMELSFSFFWWPNPRVVGEEKVANRWDAKIIELDCPPDFSGWSHIRLWMVPAYNAVLKGEAWRGGKAVKRFEVESVKQLRKVYMIGDMRVWNLETSARSLLKVQRMKMLTPEYSEEEWQNILEPVEW